MKSSKFPAGFGRLLILGSFAAVLLHGCGVRSEQLVKEADAALHKKDYARQEGLLLHALELVGRGETRERADVLYKLGDCERRLKKWDKAIEYHAESVAVLEKLSGGGSVDELAGLEQMRAIAYKTRDFTRCEEWARKYLAIADRWLDDDDPRVENGIANVLGVACLNGACKDETELLNRLVQIRLRKYGPDAQVTCAARQMAAEAAVQRKDFAKAAALYAANAEAYRETSPGLVPPVMVAYARCLHRAGKNAEALAVLQRVERDGAAASAGRPADGVRSSSSSSVPFPAEAVRVYALMGDIYMAMGRMREAGNAYATMALAADKSMGPKSQATADYLVRYAEWLRKAGRRREADAMDKRIASIYKDGTEADGAAEVTAGAAAPSARH